MFRRYRQRRGPYALAPEVRVSPVLAYVVGGILVILFLYFAGGFFFRLLGGGEPVVRRPVRLLTNGRPSVQVALDGGDLQRAQDDLKLYDGDRIVTDAGGTALLSFFDGTFVHLDGGSDVAVIESVQGGHSSIGLHVTQGAVWVQTPTIAAFSGSIERSIGLPAMMLAIPSATEALLAPNVLSVFAADGLGLSIGSEEGSETFYIGEGQQLQLPSDADLAGDLYAYRRPLPPEAGMQAFVVSSRRLAMSFGQPRLQEVGQDALPGKDLLTVNSPADNVEIPGSTVQVAGSVGRGVGRVRVNGYQALLDVERGTFVQQLALPDSATVDIRIEALDGDGLLLAEENRTIRRVLTAPGSPMITSPAKAGATYRTLQTEFEIRGTAPAGTTGMKVNDYQLQLFREGATTWSYLASTKLGNLVPGENTFNVVALGADGRASEPSVLTILLEEGPEGVVTESTQTPSSTGPLPNNAPLKPGALTVTAPQAGTEYTATSSGFLLEGTTDPTTASVSVNDYQLQLYKAGKTFWNYIVSTELLTMKRGRNVYKVVARNAKGEILDQLEYVVTYQP